MEKHEFLRKVADSGDRQVVLQYAESTATFYVKRLASFNSTVATDDSCNAATHGSSHYRSSCDETQPDACKAL